MIASYRVWFLMQRKFMLAKFIIILLMILPGKALGQVISTIAGTGTYGYNGDGISATTAQLKGAQGIAVDAAGNIYIGDIEGNRIRKITISTGLISTVAGTGTAGFNGDGIAATSAQIYTPSALTFDSNGDLYFTDRSNHRIRKITTATGIISTVSGTGTQGYNGDAIAATTAQLNNPNEVSFDASGNLFIADWQNNRVRKVDKISGLISTIAGTGTGGYNGDGIAATTAQINGPCGIIFDNAGNIYIAEYGGARVRKITISSGLISTIAGTGTFGYNGDGTLATLAQLNGCAYIKFDGAGNMYIGEGSNQRVRKITASTSIISTIAGNGTQGYNGDGITATTAWLNFPFSIYFDPNNCKMYIADYYNNRVRKITGGFTGCLPAVATGNKVSCQVLPAVTIGNTNNNIWVPVYDSAGHIAAEINANGNNLGNVTTSLYTKTGICREDWNNRLYLNRNITITPQTQPGSGNVSLRLYILKAELDSLRTAMNSMSQPSGVASINEVDVFKNNSICLTVGGNTAFPLTSTSGSYNSDYYLQVSISSFSSFYFANKLLTSILPVKLKSFTGKRSGMINELKWEASCFEKVVFNIERSAGGILFEGIGNITANYTDCNRPFFFTDNNPLPKNNYYRLRIVELSGNIIYSPVILVSSIKTGAVQISLRNNPVNNLNMDIELSAERNEQVELLIADVTGRVMLRSQLNILPGINHQFISTGNLANGVYWIYGLGKWGRTNVVKFVK